jgi:phosphohistidine phosphatase
MKLYFVRHTTAADIAPSDAQRPLTRQGEEEARIVGAALAGLKIQPAYVLSSPLLRARQTATIISRQLGRDGIIGVLSELSNGSTTSELLKALPSTDGEVMLVGHMPSLAEHVMTVTGLTGSPEVAFGKGSVCLVETECESPLSGKLIWIRHLRNSKF